MAAFFRSDNLVWKPFSWAADVLILSGLWFVCSAPLLTIGASTCALYDCVVRCVRGNDDAMLRRFFRTWKQELITSILCELLWAALVFGTYWLIRLYGNHVDITSSSVILTTAMLVILAAIVGMGCWVFPLLSRFTFSFGALNATAVRLAIAHLPRTMLLGMVTILCGYFCLQFWIPFLILPMLCALVWSLLIEPVFKPFMEENVD